MNPSHQRVPSRPARFQAPIPVGIPTAKKSQSVYLPLSLIRVTFKLDPVRAILLRPANLPRSRPQLLQLSSLMVLSVLAGIEAESTHPQTIMTTRDRSLGRFLKIHLIS
jgi:hypothetical protein